MFIEKICLICENKFFCIQKDHFLCGSLKCKEHYSDRMLLKTEMDPESVENKGVTFPSYLYKKIGDVYSCPACSKDFVKKSGNQKFCQAKKCKKNRYHNYHLIYQKKYADNKKEKHYYNNKDYHIQYYLNNREKIIKYSKEYQIKNADKLREYHRLRFQKMRDEQKKVKDMII